MPAKPSTPPEVDTAEQDHAAAYDAWFRSEVEAGIREADDPNCVWISNEEVKRRMATLREEWASRIPAKDTAP